MAKPSGGQAAFRVRSFLGVALTDKTPEHSSMTRIRKRQPEEVLEQVFTFVLTVAVEYGLLQGKTIAVDATTLEANAAMKSLVRRDTGDDWKEYVRRLAAAEGMENATEEELRRFDKKRKEKTSNTEWQSATDPDSRVTKMKDGRTHLAYKAEHALEVESELLVAAVIYRADDADTETLPVTIELAREQLQAADSPRAVEEVVADKGYHKGETLQTVQEVQGVRTDIPEPQYRGRRRWQDKPVDQQAIVYANGRRVRGHRGRRLNRLRSERVERGFAHTCQTGGGRRTWLRGVVNVAKSYLGRAAARNLGIIMLALFGIGTARSLQAGIWQLFAFVLVLCGLHLSRARLFAPLARLRRLQALPVPAEPWLGFTLHTPSSSTGC